MDPDFAEALRESESQGRSSARQAERKTRQFCRQVQQALNVAMNGEDLALFVDEVTPAPDCGRLLVHVVVPAGRVAEALAMLRCETPRLRAEVAAAIARKRAPELAFVPSAGGGDE